MISTQIRKSLSHSKIWLILVATGLALFSTPELKASHLLGGDLTYEVSPTNANLVRFKLTLYGDPSGISLGTSVPISIAGSSTTLNAPLLSTSLYNTTCSDTVIVAVFQTNYVTIASWANPNATFYYSNCCRPAGLSNLDNSSSLGIYLSVLVRSYPSTTSYLNSPQFLANSNFVIQAGVTSQISFAADDPDGDSLYYSLADSRQYSGTAPAAVPYAPGYSGAAPFDSTTTTFLDPNSGMLTVVNPSIGNYTVVVAVESYRNGQIFGRVFREQNIKAINGPTSSYQLSVDASNILPSGSAYAKIDSTHYFTVFEGTSISIDFQSQASFPVGAIAPLVTMGLQGTQNISSQNGGTCVGTDCIELTGNLQDTTQVNGVLTFTPPAGFTGAGSNARFVSLQVYSKVNDWCGGETQAYENVLILVKEPTIWIPLSTLNRCPGDTVQALVAGDTTNLVWSPSIGVSNINSASPKLFPPATTTYTVTNLNDSCESSINVIVVTDTLHPGLKLTGNHLQMSGPYNQNSAAWYYNGIAVQSYGKTQYAMNGTYWNYSYVATCFVSSDTLRVNFSNQSALVGTPFDSLEFVLTVDTISFNLVGTGPANTIDQFMIALDNYPQNFGYDWLYRIEDISHSAQTLYGVVSHDDLNNRLVIGNNLNLPLDPTHEYRVTIKNNTNSFFRFRMYQQSTMPFQDEKGIYKITQTETKARYVNPYSKYHLPLVVSFTNGFFNVDEEGDQSFARVFPNPVMDMLHFWTKNSEVKTIMVFDVFGRVVLEAEVVDGRVIDVSHFAAGIYTYKIAGKTEVLLGKFVKL